MVMAAAVAACSRRPRGSGVTPPVRADSGPEPPVVSPPPPPVVRTRGPVRARVAAELARYAAGEPMFVVFEVDNAGDAELAFDVGGDWYGLLRPLRYSWEVRDDSGRVRCALGALPPGPMAGGGGGFTPKLAPGKSYRETLLMNPACDALLEPGRYRVTLVRVLTSSDALAQAKVAVCSELSPPDTTVLAAGAPDPTGQRDAACMAALLAAPAVAAEFTVDISAHAPAELKRRVAGLPAEQQAAGQAGDNSREGAISTYGRWFCDRVRCGCPEDVRFQRVDDWLARAVAEVPDVLPAACK